MGYCWSFLYICSCKNVKDHNKRSNLKYVLSTHPTEDRHLGMHRSCPITVELGDLAKTTSKPLDSSPVRDIYPSPSSSCLVVISHYFYNTRLNCLKTQLSIHGWICHITPTKCSAKKDFSIDQYWTITQMNFLKVNLFYNEINII